MNVTEKIYNINSLDLSPIKPQESVSEDKGDVVNFEMLKRGNDFSDYKIKTKNEKNEKITRIIFLTE